MSSSQSLSGGGGPSTPVSIPNGGTGQITAALAAVALGTNRTIVKFLATSGAGTKASPWLGWDTVLLASLADDTCYYFPAGYYAYSATLDFGNHNGIVLIGDGPGKTVLGWVNASSAANSCMIQFINPSGTGTYSAWSFRNQVVGMTLDGAFAGATTGNAINGLLLSAQRQANVQDVQFQNFSNTCLELDACVTCTVTNSRAYYSESSYPPPASAFTVRPKYGLVCSYPNGNITYTSSHSTDVTSDVTITNWVAEGLSSTGYGLWLKNCFQVTVLNGTCENNLNVGVRLETTAVCSVFTNFDAESNSNGDIQDAGSRTTWIGGISVACNFSGGYVSITNMQMSTFTGTGTGKIGGCYISSTFTDSGSGFGAGDGYDYGFNQYGIAASGVANVGYQMAKQGFLYTHPITDPGGNTPTIAWDCTQYQSFLLNLTNTAANRTVTINLPTPFNLGTFVRSTDLFYAGWEATMTILAANSTNTMTFALGTNVALATGVTIPTIASLAVLTLKFRWNKNSGKMSVISATVLA